MELSGNMSTEGSRTADKVWSSSSGIGYRTVTRDMNIYRDCEIERILWNELGNV
jgi:hypothetical protein